MKEKLEYTGLKYREATPNFENRDIGWYGFYKNYKGPRGSVKTECTEVPHFSIFMSDESLSICVKLHVMNQPLKDLRKKIKDTEKKRNFFDLLKKLNSSDYDYEITISEFERSDKPRKSGDCGSLYSIYSGYIDKRRLETLEKMLLDDSKKVWFNIYSHLYLADSVESGKNIEEDIVNIINEWWDIYLFIVGS